MKLHMFFLFLMLSGCALLAPQSDTAPVQTRPVSTKETKTPSPSKKGVVWDILTSEQITLQFTNVDSGMNVSVILQKGVGLHPLSPGHWELTGYEESGRSYTSMNISKKFILKVRPNTYIYGGSILTGCPKIESKDFKLLKTMKFFNRYPFSGGSGLCEMVVGNDLASVRMQLRNDSKSKKLNIVMGF